jgi:hypothetical protein
MAAVMAPYHRKVPQERNGNGNGRHGFVHRKSRCRKDVVERIKAVAVGLTASFCELLMDDQKGEKGKRIARFISDKVGFAVRHREIRRAHRQLNTENSNGHSGY